MCLHINWHILYIYCEFTTSAVHSYYIFCYIYFDNCYYCPTHRKNMYAGGESVQMNGDTPHDAGHGGGGHGDSPELQRTGRSVI